MMDFNTVKDMLEEKKLNYFFAGNIRECTARIFIPCSDKRYCCCMTFEKSSTGDIMLSKIGYDEIDYETVFEEYVQLMLGGHDTIISGYINRSYNDKDLNIDSSCITGDKNE